MLLLGAAVVQISVLMVMHCPPVVGGVKNQASDQAVPVLPAARQEFPVAWSWQGAQPSLAQPPDTRSGIAMPAHINTRLALPGVISLGLLGLLVRHGQCR